MKPTPQQLAWQEAGFGLFFHFGPNTFHGLEWGDGTSDPGSFDPGDLDTVQWVRVAKQAGAKCRAHREAPRRLLPLADRHDGVLGEERGLA